MLETGTKAPDFELPDQNGVMHTLREYAGQKVILYFYPKDNTPGCTKQACGYSTFKPQFEEKGVHIIGISKDSVASHKRFEEKQGLTITILADTELKAINMQEEYYVSIGMPINLRSLDVKEDSLEKLALNCSRNKTRKLLGDMTLGYDEILDIYKMAY